MRITEDVPFAGKWDIIVVGGGVAGVAAAVSAARAGKKTLITEKTLTFGGLATNGLINYFVPMCNGRGKQIIYGMADEMLKMSWKVGWTTTKECCAMTIRKKTADWTADIRPQCLRWRCRICCKKRGRTYISTPF